jgi:hypothetical protein
VEYGGGLVGRRCECEGEWKIAGSVGKVKDKGGQSRVGPSDERGRSVSGGGAHGASEGSMGDWSVGRV